MSKQREIGSGAVSILVAALFATFWPLAAGASPSGTSITGAVSPSGLPAPGVSSGASPMVVPELMILDVTVVEGNLGTTDAVFIVGYSLIGNFDVTVDYSTVDGTATAGADYMATAGTLMIPAGQFYATITVPVIADDLDEPNESYTVELSHSVGATISDSTGLGTILNDDGTLTIDDVTVTEGDFGTLDAVFTVHLSQPSAEVRVDYGAWDGSALNEEDFLPTSGILTIPMGETSGTVAVPVVGDMLEEPDEDFSLELGVAWGATIADPFGMCTILNEDAALTIDDVSLLEGNAGTTDAVFTVLLDVPIALDVTVDYATQDGSAFAGEDFVQTAGTLLIRKGQVSGTIAAPVIGDTFDESDETFTVRLSNAPGVTLADASGLGTIQNDDVGLKINDVDVNEGDSGTREAVFTVSLSQPSHLDVSVDYATKDGSALAGSDYLPAAGTAMIPRGDTSTTLSVSVIGDTLDEPGETFTVELSNATGAAISDPSGLGTIPADDFVELRIADVSVAEGATGTAVALFVVSLDRPAALDVAVGYVTMNGTALAGTDYLPAGGTLMIPMGDVSATIAVPVVGDLLDEGDETFTVELSNAGGAVIMDPSGTGTIQDDDGVLAIDDVTVLEGDSSSADAVFTVSLGHPASLDVAVDYATLDVTATAGADYVATAGTLTIPKGHAGGTIAVPVLDDSLQEPDEAFTVELSSPVNATVADPSGLGTIMDEDGLLLLDNFDDGVFDWTAYQGGTWGETGGSLSVTTVFATATIARVPWTPSGLSGCTICAIETTMRQSGHDPNFAWLLGWVQDGRNMVAFGFSPTHDYWMLGQRVDGTFTTLGTAARAFDPDVDYLVRMSYDGTVFSVTIDGVPIVEAAPIAPPSGNVGFRAIQTTATFESIRVE